MVNGKVSTLYEDIKRLLNSVIERLAKLLRSSKKTVLLILLTIIVTIAASTLVSIWLNRFDNLSIPSLGTLQTIGLEAYWDESLQNKAETIDWGTMYVGSRKNVTLYLQSTSNIETTFYLNTTNWIPTNISKYMSLSWNYDGSKINPGDIIQVTITLSTSTSESFINYLITNDVRQFSFDITIGSYEYES